MNQELEILKKYHLFLHGWHSELVSLTYMPLQDRINEIRESKPVNEIPTRLKLIKELKMEDLPEILRILVIKIIESFSRTNPIEVDRLVSKFSLTEDEDILLSSLADADREYKSNIDSFMDASNTQEVIDWHEKICGCEEWNGEEIAFPTTEYYEEF